MPVRKIVPFAAAIACLSPLLALAAAPALRADDDAVRYAAVLRSVAPAVVTVMVVTKTTMQMGGHSTDHESRFEIPGVVVDPSGLIMTSIVPFAPERMLKMLMHTEESDIQIKSAASEIKVVFDQDAKENPAFLAATDSILGLAFLQLEPPAGRKLAAMDFSHPAVPAVGDTVVGISRLGKGFDSTAYFSSTRLSGEVSKPRKAWVTDHQLTNIGLPVYALSGSVAGVVSFLDSGLDDGAGASPFNRFDLGMQALAGATPSAFQLFIVPAAAVAPVIDQAREQAVRKAADRASHPPAPPPPPPANSAPAAGKNAAPPADKTPAPAAPPAP